MPRGDGTGPLGQGPGTGRGMGPGAGRGRSGGGRPGAGPGGECLCPACKVSFPHEPGTPCTSKKCPKCGGTLIRA